MKRKSTNYTKFKEKEKKRKINLKKVHARTKIKKKEMITALEKELGIVTAACKRTGISRKTHYNWLEQDPRYAEKVAEMPERTLDFVENALFKNIKAGVPSAQIFYLKTKGKRRGFVEKQEIEHMGKLDNKFEVEIIEVLKEEDNSFEKKTEGELNGIVAIAGVPRSGKTTLSQEAFKRDINLKVLHTDDLIETHDWSAVSQEVSTWFDKKEKCLIEGVAVPRALRKWLAANPSGKPCEKIIWMPKPRLELKPGQETMAKGCIKVFNEIEKELLKRGVIIERL